LRNNNNIRKNIESGLKKLYGKELQGNCLRRFNSLVGIVSGLINSQHVSLSRIADYQEGNIQIMSQVRKSERWLRNEWIDSETFYAPFIVRVLGKIIEIQKELIVVIDGSVIGRGCQVLMLSVLWKGKAIPIVWKVVQSPKGHFPENDHIELMTALESILANLPKVRCVVLGDGEYDGGDWVEKLKAMGVEYVLRTSKDRTFNEVTSGEIFQGKNLSVGEETTLYVSDCQLSGGVKTNFVMWHEKRFKEPIYLLTNQDLAQMATGYYRKRFKIETLFKDFKSEGFNLDKSKISEPDRLNRLLIICAIAYMWLIGLGGSIQAKKSWIRRVYKTQKETFNLFTIGKRLFKYLIKNGLRIPDIFKIFDPPNVSV
jgi:hypothetical protein